MYYLLYIPIIFMLFSYTASYEPNTRGVSKCFRTFIMSLEAVKAERVVIGHVTGSVWHVKCEGRVLKK